MITVGYTVQKIYRKVGTALVISRGYDGTLPAYIFVTGNGGLLK